MFWAQIIGGSAVVVAVFLTIRALRLQRRATQVNVFKDITKRIDQLTDNPPPKDKDDDYVQNWYVQLMNTFDSFAFLYNHRYLDTKMGKYYKGFIIDYCEEAIQKYPEIAKHAREEPKERFNELRKFLKKMKREDILLHAMTEIQ